jgi:hypothetical protein
MHGMSWIRGNSNRPDILTLRWGAYSILFAKFLFSVLPWIIKRLVRQGCTMNLRNFCGRIVMVHVDVFATTRDSRSWGRKMGKYL